MFFWYLKLFLTLLKKRSRCWDKQFSLKLFLAFVFFNFSFLKNNYHFSWPTKKARKLSVVWNNVLQVNHVFEHCFNMVPSTYPWSGVCFCTWWDVHFIASEGHASLVRVQNSETNSQKRRKGTIGKRAPLGHIENNQHEM